MQLKKQMKDFIALKIEMSNKFLPLCYLQYNLKVLTLIVLSINSSLPANCVIRVRGAFIKCFMQTIC